MIVCIPDVLDLTELKRLRKAIGEADFSDGRATAGYRAKRVKKNLQIKKDAGGAAEIKEIVLKGLKRNPTFKRVAIPRRVQPPLISQYEPGMSYGRHSDDALMGGSDKMRTDLSVTVFISNPDDYDGGELVIQHAYDEQQVKLPAGAAVLYPSGALHHVAPVTRGLRIVAVTWIQSFVRDAARRETLHDLDILCKWLAETAAEADQTDLAFKTYSNLLRMWSEP